MPQTTLSAYARQAAALRTQAQMGGGEAADDAVGVPALLAHMDDVFAQLASAAREIVEGEAGALSKAEAELALQHKELENAIAERQLDAEDALEKRSGVEERLLTMRAAAAAGRARQTNELRALAAALARVEGLALAPEGAAPEGAPTAAAAAAAGEAGAAGAARGVISVEELAAAPFDDSPAARERRFRAAVEAAAAEARAEAAALGVQRLEAAREDGIAALRAEVARGAEALRTLEIEGLDAPLLPPAGAPPGAAATVPLGALPATLDALTAVDIAR
jgi:hypothetical protein